MPDLKGFGGSDRPDDTDSYRMGTLTADYCGLLQTLGIDKAFIIGHDFGGAIAWSMGWQQPEACLGIAAICTPHPARAPAPPLAIFEQRFGPQHYIVRFQNEDVPDEAFAGEELDFFRFTFRHDVDVGTNGGKCRNITHVIECFDAWKKGGNRRAMVSEEVISLYGRTYGDTGFRSTTQMYRSIDANWYASEGHDLTILVPGLMITAVRDAFLPPESSRGMEARVPNLKRVSVDAGHWVTWEAAEAAKEALLRWLGHHAT